MQSIGKWLMGASFTLSFGLASPAYAAAPWLWATSSNANNWTPAVVERVQSDGFTDYVDVYTVSNDSAKNTLYTLMYVSAAAPDGLAVSTTNLGGSTLDAPSAVGWGTFRSVFVLGTDNNIYVDWTNNGVWSGWGPLLTGRPSGGFCSGPSAVSWEPGRIDVFAIACSNHALWHIGANGGTSWAGWESLGGNYANGIGSPPAAGACFINGLDVMVVDRTSNHVVDRYYDAGWHVTDSGLTATGKVTAACLAAYGTAFGRTGSSNQYFAKQKPGNSWFATQLISAVAGLPVVHPVIDRSVFNDYLAVYYRDILNHVARRGFEDVSNIRAGFWFAPGTNLATDLFWGEPNATSLYRQGGFLVFAVKSDGSLWFAHDASASVPPWPPL